MHVLRLSVTFHLLCVCCSMSPRRSGVSDTSSSLSDIRRSQKDSRLTAIKSQILDGLGFSAVPTLPPNHSPPDPKQMREAMEKFNKDRQRDDNDEHQGGSSSPVVTTALTPLDRSEAPAGRLEVPGRPRVRSTAMSPAGRQRQDGRKKKKQLHTQLVLVADNSVSDATNGEIQFVFVSKKKYRPGDLQVTAADFNILLRPRVHYGRRPGSNSSQRLDINVYAVNRDSSNNNSSTSVDRTSRSTNNNNNSNPQPPLTALNMVAPRRQRYTGDWQTLPLPTTFVQDVLDSHDNSVKLKIACDGCEAIGRELVVAPIQLDVGSSTPNRRRLRMANRRREVDKTQSGGVKEQVIADAIARSQPYIVIRAKRQHHRPQQQQPQHRRHAKPNARVTSWSSAANIAGTASERRRA